MRLEMKKPKEDLVIYNDEQRWWVTILDNSKGAILQLENSMKLQKEIQILAEAKIKDLADKQ